jgi:acetylglutamate kinase
VTKIVKIGGNELDDPGFVRGLVQALRRVGPRTMLVHGGGKEISQLQARLGLQARYVDGLRATDPESLAAAQMVLVGLVNKRLVAALVAAGIDALGLCGVDRGLLLAEKLEHAGGDLGRVGQVKTVRVEVLLRLFEEGVMPVLAPICGGDDGQPYNVNADHVAEAVARALGARELVFVSNVPGVLVAGQLVQQLTPTQAIALVADGTIHAGMIPKIRSATEALARGVAAVRITDLAGLERGTGTMVVSG